MSEADEKAREDKISPAAKEEAVVPSKDEEKVNEGGDSPEAEEKMREALRTTLCELYWNFGRANEIESGPYLIPRPCPALLS